jgi:hypothetical protein
VRHVIAVGIRIETVFATPENSIDDFEVRPAAGLDNVHADAMAPITIVLMFDRYHDFTLCILADRSAV